MIDDLRGSLASTQEENKVWFRLIIKQRNYRVLCGYECMLQLFLCLNMSMWYSLLILGMQYAAVF